MRIIFDNQVLSNTVTSSTEDANYPVSNLQDSRLSRLFRTLNSTSQWIIISGSKIKASYVAIMSHNLTPNATVLIQGSNTADFSVIGYSEAILPDWHTMVKEVGTTSGLQVEGQLYGEDLYGEELYGPSFTTTTEISFDYWRLLISDPTNSDGYIEIGGIYLAGYLQAEKIQEGMVLSLNTTSKSSISGSGQSYGDENYKYRADQFSMTANTFEKRQEWIDMFEKMDNFRPVLALIWEDDLLTEKPMYAKIEQENLSFTKAIQTFNGLIGFQMVLREVF